jgi:hypothetical protein
MTEWKEFSPLVELDSDTPLNEVQDQLVAGGEALQELLMVEHPNADAVRTAIQSIKDQLDYEVISDTWVIAHVRVGRKDELIANKRVRQVSLVYLLLHLTTILTCM